MAMKLLVVDDEPDLLKVIKSLLESLGYEVLALTDSQEAARRIDRVKFDGALVDARIPHMDGFALAKHIRNSASNNSIPIVMLTGYDDVETMRAGFRAGITFFLAKPPQLAQLGGLLRMMHGAMLKEKRSYVRLPLRTVVTCQAGSHRFTSASLNIGEGGMLLESSGGVEVGQEVDLRFSLPESADVLSPRAKVVRREASGWTAVQFVQLNPLELGAIRNYIAGRVKD